MRKFIVCTTINPLTEALKKFDKMTDWNLLVVADKSTPEIKLERGHVMSCDEQDKKYPKLSKMLGWFNVDRRNIGFLEAYNEGADIVAMIDDDNYPFDNWGEVVVGKKITVKMVSCPCGVFDPLYHLGNGLMWHRGYPVHLLQQREDYEFIDDVEITPMIQANLWNGEFDVDAIVRIQGYAHGLTGIDYCYTSNARFSPFNMQNTIVHRNVLPHLVSIPFTGRMCDIWGAYLMQTETPFEVVYGPASVCHNQGERSISSIIQDFMDEIIGYQNEHKYYDIRSVLSDKSKAFVDEYRASFK